MAEANENKSVNWLRSKSIEILIGFMLAGGGFGARSAMGPSTETEIALIKQRLMTIETAMGKIEKKQGKTIRGINLLLGRRGIGAAESLE